MTPVYASLKTIQPLFAAGAVWGWGIGEVFIAIVIVAACVAVVYIALREFGIAIPRWVVQMFWVLVVAFVAVLVIRLILTL